MKVIKWDSLSWRMWCYFETQVWKRIVTLSLLSFSLIFLFGPFSFFMASFFPFFSIFRPESHPDLWGNHSVHHPFLTWDKALIMMIITLLFTYNSILRIKYDSMWMPPAVYRDMQRIKSDMYEKLWRWPCHKYDVNYMIMQSNMTMLKHVIINGTVVSCMAIYLGMAMEMP